MSTVYGSSVHRNPARIFAVGAFELIERNNDSRTRSPEDIANQSIRSWHRNTARITTQADEKASNLRARWPTSSRKSTRSKIDRTC
jgi:hypothetical protein